MNVPRIGIKQPWLKFYPADWRADAAVQNCSLAARGLWVEMLCLMHPEGGYLALNGSEISAKQLGRLVGITAEKCRKLLEELEKSGVFSKENDGKIFSRRMLRDIEKADRDKSNGLRGGHPEIKRGTVPKDERARRFRRSDSPQKAQRIFERTNGHCHWCGIKLDDDGYHIDHVVAIRDGGGNEESNLVAACPDCNGERAMAWSGINSDHNP